jgi:hypothetical protein
MVDVTLVCGWVCGEGGFESSQSRSASFRKCEGCVGVFAGGHPRFYFCSFCPPRLWLSSPRHRVGPLLQPQRDNLLHFRLGRKAG